MNITILGAGAVGGYFGGRLAKAGVPVTFLVRERRSNQLKASGLVVHSLHGDFTLEPDLARSPEEIASTDLVIIGLKNYHLESALPSLKTLVAKGAKVLPLLNGIGHIDHLKNELGAKAVLGGACYIESTLNEMGEVVHTSPMHDIVFGSLTGEDDEGFLKELETLFVQAGVNVKKSNHVLEEMWSKYIFLSSFSGITAATRQPIGVALNDSVTRSFLTQLIVEICQVAKSQSVTLPDNQTDLLIKRMEGLSPSMTSSLHRDLEKGEPLELDSLHGALMKMAGQANLHVPNVESVYALLHPYKSGRPVY